MLRSQYSNANTISFIYLEGIFLRDCFHSCFFYISTCKDVGKVGIQTNHKRISTAHMPSLARWKKILVCILSFPCGAVVQWWSRRPVGPRRVGPVGPSAKSNRKYLHFGPACHRKVRQREAGMVGHYSPMEAGNSRRASCGWGAKRAH